MYHNGDTNALVVLLSMPRVEKLDSVCIPVKRYFCAGVKKEKLALIIIYTMLLNYAAVMSISSVCVII